MADVDGVVVLPVRLDQLPAVLEVDRFVQPLNGVAHVELLDLKTGERARVASSTGRLWLDPKTGCAHQLPRTIPGVVLGHVADLSVTGVDESGVLTWSLVAWRHSLRCACFSPAAIGSPETWEGERDAALADRDAIRSRRWWAILSEDVGL